eukprot:4072659-Pleurochrysis_carterae.AAC.10
MPLRACALPSPSALQHDPSASERSCAREIRTRCDCGRMAVRVAQAAANASSTEASADARGSAAFEADDDAVLEAQARRPRLSRCARAPLADLLDAVLGTCSCSAATHATCLLQLLCERTVCLACAAVAFLSTLALL